MSRTDTYTITVGKTATRMVVTTPPPANVAGGEWFDFNGYLEDVNGNRLAGKQAVLNANGSDLSGPVTTSSTGVWGWRASSGQAGTLTLYAKFPGDSAYEGC